MTARGFDTPINYGLRGLSPGAPRWGAGYKKALSEEANHKMTITCFVTQLPLETNRVDLDPDVKDDWGLPAMRITSTSHPDDIKNMEFFRQKSVEILEAAGANKVWAAPGQRQPRRRAQPRHLPDGQRSEDVGRQQVPSRARCAEPVHRRRQQPRHRRPQSSDDDDSGAGVPRRRPSSCARRRTAIYRARLTRATTVRRTRSRVGADRFCRTRTTPMNQRVWRRAQRKRLRAV